MSLETFFACSWLMPSDKVAAILTSLPDRRGSPASSALSEMPRLTSLSLNTSSTASARSSAFALISTALSPCQAIEAPVFLKSKRWVSSRAAWLSALSASWWSILLTMSNDESLAMALSWSLRERIAGQDIEIAVLVVTGLRGQTARHDGDADDRA